MRMPKVGAAIQQVSPPEFSVFRRALMMNTCKLNIVNGLVVTALVVASMVMPVVAATLAQKVLTDGQAAPVTTQTTDANATY